MQPVLQSMRQNTFATGPFAPGLAEQRFAHMLDQVQADRIVSASNFHLVDAVVTHMDKAMQGDLLAGANHADARGAEVQA